ncbi:MAG: CdaR family protein, partial [Clostridia bacterium]|nr:CdaR family protein [Clostridia bacterium]
ISAALSGVNAVAAVPQQNYDAAEAAAYNPRVDLSKISTAGTQLVKIISSTNSNYGKLVSVTPETIEITVEEYKTRSRIPVSVTVEGKAPEGWYMSAATADPALITISGPQSVIDSVSRARVMLNADEIEWNEGVCRTATSFMLYDRNGEQIDPSLLEVTTESVLIDSIIVEQNIYPTKKVRIRTNGVVTGEPAEGYVIGDITFGAESVSAAGRQEVLDQLGNVRITGTVDVTGAEESITTELKLKKPSDIVHLSADTVTVTVTIVPAENGGEQQEDAAETET